MDIFRTYGDFQKNSRVMAPTIIRHGMNSEIGREYARRILEFNAVVARQVGLSENSTMAEVDLSTVLNTEARRLHVELADWARTLS